MMRHTVRSVATSAEATCIGDGAGAPCEWHRRYDGPRSERSAMEAVQCHLERYGHGAIVEATVEKVYSSWPDKYDIQAWGLAEFEEDDTDD